MIRRAIAIALCSVTFFLIAFVIPVKAGHPFTTNLVCHTFEAGLEAAQYFADRDTETVTQRAKNDNDFACYWVESGYSYWGLELVHQYKVNGQYQGMVRALDADGREVFTFGTMEYIDTLFHRIPDQGA